MDVDSSIVLLRQALAADPELLPIAMEYRSTIAYRRDLLQEYSSRLSGSRDPLLRCLAIMAEAPTGYPAAGTAFLLQMERSSQGSPCSAAYLGYFSVDLTPTRIWYQRGAEYLRRALERYPGSPVLWARRAALLSFLGRDDDARASVQHGLASARHAMEWVPLYDMLVSVIARTRDSARAPELRRALAAAVLRDGRPGVKFIDPDYIQYLDPVAAAEPTWERTQRERVRLAVLSGSGWLEWSSRRSLGAQLSDVGRPEEALAQLDRVVRIADSAAAPLMQLEAYRFRGRTYAKLGRFREAERDLRHAVAVGTPTRDPYLLAEAVHNLAHAYEGEGRMRDAARTVDRFIELTRPLQHAQPRMMSLRDAGIIRRKAGWPASANAAFEEMVRVVDQQERGHYWAGEYFEQIGDLARALQYFQQGVRLDPGERSLNLGGTARVFQALGQLDSAEASARAHDSIMSNQLDVPLLPPILAAAGRSAEALEISRRWARKQIAQGNLQGAAMATNGLADLLLRAGDPRQSLSEAMAAESLAQRANLTDEVIRALRVEGQSRARLGQDGLGLLRRAAALAEAHPTTEGVLETQLALAAADAATGRTPEALLAYHRGARVVEQVAQRLGQDLDRARFRDHQLAAFDGAIELLLRQAPGAGRLEAITAWSQRRKAASLALATGVSRPTSGATPSATLSATALRRRLPARSALLDYLTVGGRAAVLVTSTREQRLVDLPLSPDSLRRLADRLRNPLVKAYAGRLDLARAPFDLAVAHQLYAALLGPLEPLLDGIDHLLVVPDGPLHYIAFDALVRRLPEAPAGDAFAEVEFVLDRFQVELLPSAQFLANDQARQRSEGGTSSGNRVLVIAHDAPGATQEAAAIQAAWPERSVRVLAGDAASEGALQQARGFDILHFAAHAEADDREPQASHLRLAPDELNDGFLHLREIAEQRLHARLVVLSACETHAGALYRGEGLMGLARAFLTAGANAVVATEWPIGSAAADLMGEFHRRIAAGVEPAAALREAKQILRARHATSHPFYWAGFVLLRGAPDHVEQQQR